MRLVRISEAAKLLNVNVHTLRRRLYRSGKEYVTIYGQRIRAYPADIGPDAERWFDADEITRLMTRLGTSGRL